MSEMHGTIEVDDGPYYYLLEKCISRGKPVIVASFMDDTYASEFRSSLIDSTVYVMVVAFSLILMILMIWAFSIIHPLNQIRVYISQIKQGKDVELNIKREDEIGEVARELISMKEELSKQQNAKEEMIHNISHDLKTPIATIKSYSESIKDGIYPYGDLESSVDVILNNAQRLEDKVHSLLYLNRIEYLITTDAEGVVTNMKEVVEQVVLNSAVIDPDIRLITDVEEVFFDGLLEGWRVAIENIMENAFRYAKTYIKIVVRENDIRIYNDGPKMPEDRIETLIQPLNGGVELGDYLETGYFEQEMDKSVATTCIEEIWNEFPSMTQYEVRSALAKCGLTTKHIESKVKVLSGGEQAKVRLCKLINKPTNILLLDEPTNHLDVDAKSELKRALSEYKGSILMVCHEPEFYDRLATDVWDCSQWSTRI